MRMENNFFGKYFQLAMCFNGFDSEIGFSQNFYFKPFLDSYTKRERERAQITPSTSPANPEPRSRHEPFPLLTQHDLSSLTATHSSDRALVRRPTLHQSRRSQHRADRTRSHRSCRSQHCANRSTTPIKQRSTPTPLDLAFAARSHLRLCRAISPLDQT